MRRGAVAAILLCAGFLWVGSLSQAEAGIPYTKDFMRSRCTFSTTGNNPFFILQPGYRMVLEGREDGKKVHLTITVLNETVTVDGVDTRVVEEVALEDGLIAEHARNYFAICQETNSVFYFGEDVDIYNRRGEIISHDGSWQAGVAAAQAGVIMPGTIMLGAKYYQELAPGVALDRAQITSMSKTVATPADIFYNCLQTRETTPLHPRLVEYKLYARDVGIVKDGRLKLTSYGFVP